MKKMKVLVISSIVLIITVSISNDALAGPLINNNFKNIAKSFRNAHNNVFTNRSASDVISSMRSIGYDVQSNMYVDLREGETSSWTYKYLEGGYHYVIIGISDDDSVSDVDLEVQYADGTPFKADDSTGDLAYINFDFSYSHEIRIRITNYASDTPYYKSTCRFIIFRK